MTTINWQQPFVNTFKHFAIASDKNCIKHGDISTIMDSQIKSTVYKIIGSSPASNFINMPKMSGQSLGLTGRYIYFLFKPVPNKCFSLHIDIATHEKVTIRVSLSNLFKEFKVTSTWLQFPYVIQAPKGSVYEKTELNAKDLSGSAPPITKWTILCIDLISLTQSYSNRTYQCVRGYKLCANMYIKNVITSDLLYEPGITHAEARLRNTTGAAFPRELAYPCEKYENWHLLYDYVSFPSESFRKPFDSVGQSRVLASFNNKQDQSNETNEPKRAQVKQVYTANNCGVLKHSAIDTLTEPKKYPKFQAGAAFNLPLVGVSQEISKFKPNQDLSVNYVSPDDCLKQNQQDIHVFPFKSTRTLSSLSSSTSSIMNNSDIEYDTYEDAKEELEQANSKPQITNYQTKLEPDPILRLKKIIGFGSGVSKYNKSHHQNATNTFTNNYTNFVRWSKDNQFILYPSQAILIAYHVNTSAQYCFLGHSDKISCLTLSPDNSIIASGQTGPYSLVRLWDFQSRKCLAIFRNHEHSLFLLEYSYCGNYLCGVGKDKQGKTMLCLWDVRDVRKSGNSKLNESPSLGGSSSSAKLIAKAHTDIHISRIMFVHFDSTRLITCGRDNVRFWRLKNDTLRSCAVNLSPYIQSLNMNNLIEANDEEKSVSQKVYLEFTDIGMNTRADSNENLVYACTRNGQIFVFNMAKMEIEHVRVLEPLIKKTGILNSNSGSAQYSPALRLNTLTVSDSFCATGSDDGFVRIWPLDFGQVTVEAEHEAPIGVVRFSTDCLRICTATLNGNLGVLDVKQKEYLTLVRSHTETITDLSFDPSCKFIATCSYDYTVRVWNYDNCRQLYDFSAPHERPTRLCFHPIGMLLKVSDKQKSKVNQPVFACGFNSGKIRVFNVVEAKLLFEIDSPHSKSTSQIDVKYEITDLKYANEGKRLISGDMMKYVCMYDVERDYQLLRLLPNTITSFGSLSISPDHKNLALIGPTDHIISVYESISLNEILRIDISTSSSTDNDYSMPNTTLSSFSRFNSKTTSIIGVKSETASRLEYASYDLNQILCVTSSNKLLKFDSRNGRLLSSIPRIHRSLADCLSVSSDGRFLVTSGDNSVKIWDYEMRLEKNFQTFIGHSSAVSRVVFTSDNSTLISVGDSIVFWDFLAFTTETETKLINEIPQGREFESMRDLPIAVVREIQQDSKFLKELKTEKNNTATSKNINDYNQFKILNEISFDEMRSKSPGHQWSANVSIEKPRTPPIAADNIHIETIAINGEIEDTFLNDDLTTLLDSNLSSCGNSEIQQQSGSNFHYKVKKFVNLPNFVSNTNEKLSSSLNNIKINRENEAYSSQFVNGQEMEMFYINEQQNEFDSNDSKPNCIKHLNMRKKKSLPAKRRYVAPENKCGLKLNSVIGYNGKHSSVNMIWNPEREFFAFTLGSIICVEDLKTGKQKLLYGHQEDVTCLSLRNDCIHMASGSAHLLNTSLLKSSSTSSMGLTSGQSSSKALQCQISIWDCETFECVIKLYHKNASNINCLSYSSDDRFLISISDYASPSLIVWNTYDYSSMVYMDNLSYIVNDLAWNPLKCNEFVLCGQDKVLSVWYLEEKPMRSGALRCNELEVPSVICEQQNGQFDFTSVCYSEDYLLFAATNYGLITVWNAKTNACFLNWQADTNEIDVLISIKNKLINGSSKGSLKLWDVSSIHEMKHKHNKASLRLDGLIIENEIGLNSGIKSCKFDSALDIGIVATNKGTLWYVNWSEETSVRLVSTHTAKINSILCVNDKYLSTVSDDGSLSVWSINDRERIVQFEVKSKALCQSLINCDSKLFQKITKYMKITSSKNQLIASGYSDGSVRIFDMDKKNIVSKMQVLSHEITALNYCKNTSIMLAGSIEGSIAIIDLNQAITTRIIQDHKGAPINSIDSFYKEDKKITFWLASSRDRRVSVWNSKFSEDMFQMIDWLTFPAPAFTNDVVEMKNSKSTTNLKDWFKYPPSLAQFAPNNPDTIIYVGYALQKQILFYSISKKQILRSMSLSEWPECLSISPSCNLIAFGTKTRLLQIKDYNQSTFQDYAQHSDCVASVCFSSDGKRLFSTSFNEIFIWDVNV